MSNLVSERGSKYHTSASNGEKISRKSVDAVALGPPWDRFVLCLLVESDFFLPAPEC